MAAPWHEVSRRGEARRVGKYVVTLHTTPQTPAGGAVRRICYPSCRLLREMHLGQEAGVMGIFRGANVHDAWMGRSARVLHGAHFGA